MTGAATTVAYEATPVSNIVDWGQKFDAKIKTLVKGANKIVNKLEAVTTRLASFNKGLAKASQFLETQLGEDQAWEGATEKPEKFDKSNSWPQDDAYAEDQVWEGATEKPGEFDKSNSWPQDDAYAEDQAWEGATAKPEEPDQSDSWPGDERGNVRSPGDETPRTICFDDTVEWMEDELEDYGPSRADDREWWSVLKRDIDEIHCLILESEPFESIDDVKSLVKEEGCSSFNRKAAKSFNEHDCDIDFVFEADARDSDVIDDGERSVNCQTSPDSPKDKVTAGPAKVRTLGTFLAELLVREEDLFCCWRQATGESITR